MLSMLLIREETSEEIVKRYWDQFLTVARVSILMGKDLEIANHPYFILTNLNFRSFMVIGAYFSCPRCGV